MLTYFFFNGLSLQFIKYIIVLSLIAGEPEEEPEPDGAEKLYMHPNSYLFSAWIELQY